MATEHHTIMQDMLNSSLLHGGLPPSFEGNQYIFASALFCTMFATLISLNQIYGIAREMVCIPDGSRAPINIYRWILMLMYSTVIIASGPDAVYLWTYNEVSADTTQLLLTLDRVLDSVMVIPFLLFTWLQVKCGPVLKFQLIKQALPFNLSPDGSLFRNKSNIMAAIMMIFMSVVVTLSK
jgi:hypothetical protein